ncbi:MAG: DUF2232 domain-containing protein [Thermoanaerobaculia bacterium]
MSGEIPGAGSSADRRRITFEILAAAAAAVLFFLAFLLIPVAGTLALPFAAVPAVRLAHRHGAAAAIAASGVGAGLILGIATAIGSQGPSLAALAGSVTLLPALLASAVRRGVTHSRAFLVLCVAGFLPIAGLAVADRWSGESAVAKEISATFDQVIPAAVESSKRSTRDAEMVERVRRTFTAARDIARRFWPGLLGASWVLAAGVAFYAGARAARPAPSAAAARFEDLRAPAPAAALFVVTGGCAALTRGVARDVAGSLLIPLTALFFLVGLSIICHFARRWFRARVLRICLYVLLVYFFPMNLGVALLGLFDWYADFRRRGEGAAKPS